MLQGKYVYLGNAWFIGSNNGGINGQTWYRPTYNSKDKAASISCINNITGENTTHSITIIGTFN
jgi:hypothetical protein